jgi:cell division protein FtsI (penicillin-binding protein 3)
VYQGKRRVVRRVFRESVTDDVRKLLEAVVDSGTAVKADLASYQVAGKSGTARRSQQGKGYIEGSYTASFVGVFPAENPQFVVLVKLDSPQRSIYGGDVAAPVTAIVLRAAIAARDAALDRSKLASVERDVPLGETRQSDASKVAIDTASVLAGPARPAEPELQPASVVALPYARPRAQATAGPRPVPDVTGLSVRAAVRALHQSGFRVMLAGDLGAPTDPSAGTVLPAGSIVKLQHTR